MKYDPTQPVQIPDHELIRCVGSGNYGEVWLAQNVIKTYRAVKIIHRTNFPIQRPYDREFAGIMKFEPLSRNHPGFVSVLHIGRNDASGYFYYIMELADDAQTGPSIIPQQYAPKTLRSELSRRGVLPVEPCLKIGLELSSALGHLHHHKLVHRDIKPSNIIFVEARAKLADIGLVSDIDEGSTFVGSEGYVPPEGPGKPAADVYGLGKVLYQMLTGRNPMRDFPELPADFDTWPDAPARRRFFSLILKACEFNPVKRIQNARELYRSLEGLGLLEAGAEPALSSLAWSPPTKQEPVKISMIGDTGSRESLQLVEDLESRLRGDGFAVFTAPYTGVTIDRAREIEDHIVQADYVLVMISPLCLESEMLTYELHLARSQADEHGGKPGLIPVWIHLESSRPPFFKEAFANAPSSIQWEVQADTEKLYQQLHHAFGAPIAIPTKALPPQIETPGGAVPLQSPFYVTRAGDAIFCRAIAEKDSIVLIKGARQMGKTSLLARGLMKGREEGYRVILTDFQKLNAASLESLEKFYFALAGSLADQLDLAVQPEDTWNSRRSPNENLEGYLRKEVLQNAGTVSHLVWGMDEIDRIFASDFYGEAFALFRSWHNHRALDPTAPWSRITLALVYATEARLLITDLMQSPFNVGTRVELSDFTVEQVKALNHLHGDPLGRDDELSRLIDLVGGHPYLTRRALHELVEKRMSLEDLVAGADSDEGVFGDHLRRLVMLLAKDPSMVEAVRQLCRGRPCGSNRTFSRLRSAGLVTGISSENTRLRCSLYEQYFRNVLGE